MGYAEDFGADWGRVVGAPMLAGIAVTAAEPGGLWGAVKESAATAGALRDAKGSNPLIDAVIAAYETSEGRDLARGVLRTEVKGKAPAAVVEAALAELQAVSALVTAKAPDAAPGFRDWLQKVASRVAEAGTEGGFLGFGGEKVSATEKATLEKLATASGLGPPGTRLSRGAAGDGEGMRILVTGGAGYIGSHTLIAVLAAGHEAHVVDNFSNSHPEALGARPPALQPRLRRHPRRPARPGGDGGGGGRGPPRGGDPLRRAEGGGGVGGKAPRLFRQQRRRHASRSWRRCRRATAGASSSPPRRRSTAIRTTCRSTRATRAGRRTPTAAPSCRSRRCWRTSRSPTRPGRSRSCATSTRSARIPRARSARTPRGSPTTSCPSSPRWRSGGGRHLNVFGDDYDTPDGTGVRDYIHVTDLARAHLAAVDWAGDAPRPAPGATPRGQGRGCEAFNLGTGQGTSVREMVAAFAAAAGRPVPTVTAPRRAGDIAACWADPAKAAAALGWRAELGLEAMCREHLGLAVPQPPGLPRPGGRGGVRQGPGLRVRRPPAQSAMDKACPSGHKSGHPERPRTAAPVPPRGKKVACHVADPLRVLRS